MAFSSPSAPVDVSGLPVESVGADGIGGTTVAAGDSDFAGVGGGFVDGGVLGEEGGSTTPDLGFPSTGVDAGAACGFGETTGTVLLFGAVLVEPDGVPFGCPACSTSDLATCRSPRGSDLSPDLPPSQTRYSP